MYVCLWSPAWSTAAASAAEGGGRPNRSNRSGGGAAGSGTGGRDGDDAAASGDAPPTTYDLAPLLAEHAPRLRVESEVIWADGRGLDAAALAGRLLERLADEGVAARAGVAAIPVTAELAARWGPNPGSDADGSTPFLVKERTGWGRRAGSRVENREAREGEGGGGGEAENGERVEGAHPQSPHRRRERADAGTDAATPRTRGRDESGIPQPGGGVVAVEEGVEAEWQSALPISALRPPDRTKALFDGVGITTVGQLAALEREAVEVRFGGKSVALWRAARADDRLLFDRIPADRPQRSLDFVDYVLTDPARLVFTANALLGPLCDGLTARGEHARTLRLELPLANGDTWARTLRPARPTASRETWLRMLRGLLDELTVPDAVAGMRLEVPSTETAAVRQGDLFDRGFATASAVEAAVARLAERQVWPVVPATDAHPRIERRGGWERQELTDVANAHRGEGDPSRDEAGLPPPGSGAEWSSGIERRGLSLQLMPEPRRITIETRRRRDHEVPTRLRDRTGWRDVAHAAGPDRISGGQWEASSYAREYWRCVTGEGVPLWIYRDALDGGWYLHGWWD
jgi:protein ImuB